MQVTTDRELHSSVWRRLGWFALLWCASLAFWVALAYGVKLLLNAGG